MANINQPTDVQEPRFEAAYDRLLPEIDALPASALVVINIDVPSAVTSAIGAWREISTLRSELAAKLKDFDLAQFDKLEAYALATGHAHALYMAASAPAGLTQLSEEVAKVRELLLSDAVALAKRGVFDGQKLKELKGPPGYKNIAFDLLALVAMFREKWSVLDGKTLIQPAELKAAQLLADRLISAVGEREQTPVQAVDAAERRQRAFSLFVNAYDQARRAIQYVRWAEGDVDSIAPSLYSGRGNSNVRRRGAEGTEPVAPVPVVQVQAPVAVNGGGAGSPQAPVAGLPGGAPFTAS